MAKIKLGKTYKDRVTGIQGVAICYTKHLTGCDSVGLQPPADKDGKVPESRYVDVTVLDHVKKKAVKIEEKAMLEEGPGGPREVPRRCSTPRSTRKR